MISNRASYKATHSEPSALESFLLDFLREQGIEDPTASPYAAPGGWIKKDLLACLHGFR